MRSNLVCITQTFLSSRCHPRSRAPHASQQRTHRRIRARGLSRVTDRRPIDPELALALATALHPRLGRAAQLATLGADLLRHVLQDCCCGAPRICL